MKDQGIKKGSLLKVLVVEDNRDNRELVVKILECNGYEAIEAVNGQEAIEKAKAENPSLILMDMYLPIMDGYEATKRIKIDGDLKDIPVIALTAHAMKGDMEKALAAGCDDYITKPIDVRKLPKQIDRFLNLNT